MNKDELIRLEQEQSERNPELREGATGERRNRTRAVVYSVRLNPEEVARIEAAAERAEVPASTLVRGWVLRALAELETDTPTGAMARIEADLRRLRELLST